MNGAGVAPGAPGAAGPATPKANTYQEYKDYPWAQQQMASLDRDQAAHQTYASGVGDWLSRGLTGLMDEIQMWHIIFL